MRHAESSQLPRRDKINEGLTEVSTARVLVIEDEPLICWSIQRTLSAAGYEVAVAETAAAGVELFRKLLPAVVFLDVQLPDNDGFSVLDKLKAVRGQKAAVVVMTAADEANATAEAARLGAHAYLKKPFDVEELEAIVQTALEKSPLT